MEEEENMSIIKKCTCGRTGPENFYRNKSMKDGLSFYCKTCATRKSREAYAKKYPEGKGPRGAPIGNSNAKKETPQSG